MAEENPQRPRQTGDLTGVSVKELLQDPRKQKELKKEAIRNEARRSVTGGLRPEDIGVVRVEFTVPASRLFGGNGQLAAPGGPSRIIADNDTDDPVVAFNSDANDGVITINPGPGHFDGVD
jgi:hypothetical protein